MKKLLVASIYTPVSYNNNWLDTQLKFLNLTTEDYDFGVFCNNIDPKYFPSDIVIIGYQNNDDLRKHLANNDYQTDDDDYKENGLFYKRWNYEIRVAYFKIMEYFKDHADEYDNFLLIDSDIFPVCPNWQDILTKRMEATNRWYAAFLRSEFFESYPWLGFFYIRGQYIHEEIADWFPREYENMWGKRYREFGTVRNKTHHEGESIWYPLLRSNVVNLHPLRFGIYNHLFYHHAKGSWNKDDHNFKVELTVKAPPELWGYYDHYMHEDSHSSIAEDCHKKLIEEPENFICQLMGVDSSWFKGNV